MNRPTKLERLTGASLSVIKLLNERYLAISATGGPGAPEQVRLMGYATRIFDASATSLFTNGVDEPALKDFQRGFRGNLCSN